VIDRRGTITVHTCQTSSYGGRGNGRGNGLEGRWRVLTGGSKLTSAPVTERAPWPSVRASAAEVCPVGGRGATDAPLVSPLRLVPRVDMAGRIIGDPESEQPNFHGVVKGRR
jgi:hypothetical protein